MSIPTTSPWSWAWVRTPFWRILGSFVSWFLFALCMSLLLLGFFAVLSLGGACASGPSAYEIAVECPKGAELMPLAVFGGLAAVVVSVLFAQGFGVSLTDLGWPILFGSLGAGFIVGLGSVGLFVGIVFVVMALVPLLVTLIANPQRVFLGAVTAGGERFYEGEKPRFSPFALRYRGTDQPVQPTASHWLFSLVVWIAAVGLGYYAALAINAAL